MNQNIREDLKAYLDGELDPQRAQEVRAAIERDETLREEIQFMQTLSSSFRALRPRHDATPEMAEAAAVKIAKPRRSILRSPWVWSGATVLLLAIVFARPALQTVSKREGLRLGSGAEIAAPASSRSSETENRSAPSVDDKAGLDSGAHEWSPDSEASAARMAPGAPQPATSPPVIPDRNIIWNGELAVRVESVEKAKEEVVSLVSSWRGYIKSSTLGDSKSQTPHAEMIIRIPVAKFDEAMSQFEKLGERVSGHSDSDDVTEQIVDIEARLRTMKAQEETYRQLLGQAKTVGQVMEVQDRLSALRADIESFEARAAKLKELSSLSTIRLTLIQRPSSEEAAAPSGWAGDAWATAVGGVTSALRALATAVIFVFVWIPVWLPFSILAIAVYRRLVVPRT